MLTGGDRSFGGIPSLIGPADPIYAHRAAVDGIGQEQIVIADLKQELLCLTTM